MTNWSSRIGQRLKPRDLHVFMVVAEEKSMAKAAERLAVSRPVISKTIGALEDMLGVTLLDRTPFGVEPTLFGIALHRRGHAVFDELRQALHDIDFLKSPAGGELRVSCTEVWAAGLVPEAIARMMRNNPGIRVHMEQSVAATQFSLLRDRICELVITRLLAPAPDVDVDMQTLCHEPLVIVAGLKSPWLRRKRLALSDLVDAPWILSASELGDESPFVKAFRAENLPVPQPAIVSNSLHARNSLLATGRFLTLVPGSALLFGCENQLLKPLAINLPRWERPTCLFHLKGRTLSPVAELFIKHLHEISALLKDETLPKSIYP